MLLNLFIYFKYIKNIKDIIFFNKSLILFLKALLALESSLMITDNKSDNLYSLLSTLIKPDFEAVGVVLKI